MAAAENQDSWLDLQRMREERMRYEVLRMLYDRADGQTGVEMHCGAVVHDLGVWHAEVFRVIEYLSSQGWIQYLRAGPVVRLTEAGVRYIETEGENRRTVR